MATTTSNFGWAIPQSTDLVKDGATAIANLGSGIDTSMGDLKGGSSGQILSKASATDMDFTWVDANPGDITGVTAGTGLTGGGTSGSVTLNLDSTYYLLANQTRRNAVLNSNFSVWQRGTSIAVSASSNAYTADRWNLAAGANQASTVSRQATGDTTNLPNIQYCTRVQRNSGQTGTATMYFQNSFESLNSIAYAGKAVTLSFYARAGANYSPSGSTLYGYVVSGTGTDQGLQSGYTGAAFPVTATATLTTTWQRFTATGTISSSATEIGIQFQWAPTGTAGANDYFEITGVQLELGSVANTYQPNGATYQAELAACQRYYYQTTNGNYYLTGTANNTTDVMFAYPMPTAMRIYPAISMSSTSDFTLIPGSKTLTSMNASGGSAGTANVAFYTSGSTGLTANYSYQLYSTTGTLKFNSEL